jgi:cytochrome c oxidase subunit 2
MRGSVVEASGWEAETLRSTKTRRALAFALIAAAVLCVAGVARAQEDPLHLMPESASAEANEVDALTYLILWITGITMVGVQGLLVWFLFRYRRRPGEKSKFTHGNHAVELVWTVTPALILVFLALYQMKMWMRLKARAPEDNQGAVPVQILAKQFEWNFRMPGPDGAFGTDDDRISKVLVVPVGHPVNAELRSLDVIHSFFLPNFRFKQDAVPGLTIPFWFKPTKLSSERRPVADRNGGLTHYAGTADSAKYWDIVCAELCGISHTNMSAMLFVVTQDQYDRWMKDPASVPEIPGGWSKWNKANPVSADDNIWVRWDWQTKQFDEENRMKMHPAKLKREPFGTDETPAQGAPKEDI